MTLLIRPSPGIARTRTPEVVVFAPTGLEAWAARRALAGSVPVHRVGIGVARTPKRAEAVVICGLAGSLSSDLNAGAVVIPSRLALPGGETIDCDAELHAWFVRAARHLGYEPSTGPMVTVPRLLTGDARRLWHARGFAAADMESALPAIASNRRAVVRVILDAPGQEISEHWLSPLEAIARPWLWPQAIRLAAMAPRYALRAARIVARGLAENDR